VARGGRGGKKKKKEKDREGGRGLPMIRSILPTKKRKKTRRGGEEGAIDLPSFYFLRRDVRLLARRKKERERRRNQLAFFYRQIHPNSPRQKAIERRAGEGGRGSFPR